MTQLAPWFILFLPLLAAVGITLFTLKNRAVSAALSIGAIVIGFGLSVVLFIQSSVTEFRMEWFSVGSVVVDFGLKLDRLSQLMLLVVTGVGSAIHIYSYGYMHEDRSVGRYFAGLSLFTFSMLGIVLANNFVMMFVCWELVGVSSYLLIGFWYEKPSAAEACKKAFLTNRVGDFGFLLGILLVWSQLHSLNFGELQAKLTEHPGALGGLATVAGLLVFCGAMGKSAQFPLHVWLPDAMEGPTPVSALIHAATMVAAGVYMLCRVFFLLNLPGSAALHVIAWIGGITALLAALMAVQQSDIKRILAYSTLSQLGYMVLAVGVSAGSHPGSAMYHLTTHAFFKALLFLGAGSVIHALHHEQDIWRMGALTRKMPITFWTFLLATLALCGVPPLSGFFSKDAILAGALHHGGMPLFVLATTVAALTAFYMFRLVLVAFLGPAKSQAPDHAHESPAVMTGPLVALAIPSVLAGFWGIDRFLAKRWVEDAGEPLSIVQTFIEPFHHAPVAAVAGWAAAALGIVAAFAVYKGQVQDPLPAKLGALSRWMRDRFYFDELYDWIIRNTQDALAGLADFVDRWVVAGVLVKGTHGTVEMCGRLLRLLQTGNLQTYAFLFVTGVTLVLYFVLVR